MNDIGAMVERLNLFAEERDALAASLFADSHHLNFDADGRVSLPAHCWRMPVSKKSCALSAWAANSRFESARFCRFQIESRAMALEQRGLLRIAQSCPAGGTDGSQQ